MRCNMNHVGNLHGDMYKCPQPLDPVPSRRQTIARMLWRGHMRACFLCVRACTSMLLIYVELLPTSVELQLSYTKVQTPTALPILNTLIVLNTLSCVWMGFYVSCKRGAVYSRLADWACFRRILPLLAFRV